ncbi:hypothetical protein B0F90DRAFT_238613 [Multifurca ochricompacta]|uniref:AMP-activated protein kinase glycogen-binding domain-containing protein n=1 Tax=Multifurca ochricompacta TaxID=376703 RepID=A0AAD4LVZ0_9AGAM|nr:hypothetical protein B0F90DRAFT_238613 [Multifurca ochricompacta]
MPGITTGFSLRLPSFISSYASHLCIQWSSSLRLTRKPDGFEAPPIFIPWKDKFAYKFIVDGRWMTNDAEPTEIDHGFVNNVYTAPQKPALQEPIHATAPPSYHSESEAEPEPAEKAQEHAEEPVANGSAHGASHEPPAHEQVPTLIEEEEVKAAVEPVVEAAQAAVAQVAPSPQEVEKAAYEVCFNIKVSYLVADEGT